MRKKYSLGLEFEYWLVRHQDRSVGGIYSFNDLTFSSLKSVLMSPPGVTNARLYSGDAGIKAGYWYAEGDERFSPEGQFVRQVIKGIEIRTPPQPSLSQAMSSLRQIEKQLRARLYKCHFELAISAYHPTAPQYQFIPPLNTWELRFRDENPSFHHADLAMLTCGPDINISIPKMSNEQVNYAVKKLTFFSPYMIILSLNGPFMDGNFWGGLSQRTFLRSCHRPACKGYLLNSEVYPRDFIYPARRKCEHGRIEFKAFDAIFCPKLLEALSAWVLGLVLDDSIDFCYKPPSDHLFKAIAKAPFSDLSVKVVVKQLLTAAKSALKKQGLWEEAQKLNLLDTRLDNQITPADEMIIHFMTTGELLHYGGLWSS